MDWNKHQVACAGLPAQMSLEKYFATLDALEVSLLGPPSISPKGLGRWRKSYPDKSFALRVPAAPEHRELVEEAISKLSPNLVVVRPNQATTPTTKNREEIATFLGLLASRGQNATFVPTGVWPTDLAAEWIEKFNIWVPIMPLDTDPLTEWEDISSLTAGRPTYALVRAKGKRLRAEHVETLEDSIAEATKAWICLAHDNRYPDAKKLTKGGFNQT